MEHVGLTEKLTIRREGNSMRQWKRRQRDWQRVSEDMAAKTGKASVSSWLAWSTSIEPRPQQKRVCCCTHVNEKDACRVYCLQGRRYWPLTQRRVPKPCPSVLKYSHMERSC